MRSVVERYRGSSVRVFSLDREGVLAELRRRAEALVAADPRVLEVRLFGSLARGGGRPGSDADLIVVLAESDRPFLDRAPQIGRHLTGAGIGCDLLVYTADEIERMRAEGNALVRAADREGVVLAGRGP